jgi:dienelactone hydrolase
MKRRLVLQCALALGLLAGMPSAWAQAHTKETFILQLEEAAYGLRPVPVELWIPRGGTGPYPLIITQHGSGRDGHRFEGGQGQTDVYSTRLMQAAVARGFAVAALDAFYEKNIAPSDKTRFPNAATYGARLRGQLLLRYPQLDTGNTFYTGFSYGGDSTLSQLSARNLTPWTAVAAAEPGCNTFHKPRPLPYPVLILKGSESHYYPRACQIAAEEHQKFGNRVEVVMFEKANHYFSLRGEIVPGLAFNGCANNPVIVDDAARTLTFYDGTPTTWPEVQQRCFRREGGKGQTREKMDEAIERVIVFFTQAIRR